MTVSLSLRCGGFLAENRKSIAQFCNYLLSGRKLESELSERKRAFGLSAHGVEVQSEARLLSPVFVKGGCYEAHI
jgi:hypothetical protein